MTPVWLSLACLAASDLQQDAESAFRAGVEARTTDTVARPHFLRAAEAYARMREAGANNISLHRNEGHARALAGDIPGAILAYHRGLRLDPDDAGLRNGLAYARSQVAYASAEEQQRLTPPTEAWPFAKLVLRRYGLFVLTLLALSGWLSLTVWLTTRRQRWLFAGIAFLVVAAVWTGARAYESDQRVNDAAAVVSRPTFLRQGNGVYYPLRRESPLPAGVEVAIRTQRGDWLQVELADGALGWLPAQKVQGW